MTENDREEWDEIVAEVIEEDRELGGSASTTEVADAVGCDRRTAHLRLTELGDEDVIEGRNVGRAYLWSVSEVPA